MQAGSQNSVVPFSAHAALKHFTSKIPLFHAAWLFAVGIAVTQTVWLRPSLILLALVPVATLCCLAAFRAQRLVWLPLAVLWFFLGTWCAEMQPHPVPAPAVAALSDGLLRTVEGTVINAGTMHDETIENVGESSGEGPSQRVDLRVSTIEVVNDAEDVPKPADGAIRLTVRWPQNAGIASFNCGDRIRAVVRLLPPETYRNPGAWSRADYLLGQGITTTASVAIDRVELNNLRKTISSVPDWADTDARQASRMAFVATCRRDTPPFSIPDR